MKQRINIIRRITAVFCLLLVLVILANSDGPVIGKLFTANETPYYANGDSEVVGTQFNESVTELRTVAENDYLRFDYDEAGADIYLTDKRTGKIWSNTVDGNYYTQELSNSNLMSQLMSINYAKENGSITTVNVFEGTASSFSINPEYAKNELTLKVTLNSAEISFDIHMWLDEDGLNYEIPSESVKENSTNMLVNIQMMPTFGAAVSGEKGYILLPDGSGTLVNYKSYDDPNAKLYTFSFYGTDQLDISEIQKNADQGYYGLMLPVYGINHEDGAVLTAVTEGEADTTLSIAPAGFKFKGLNRAYLTFNYRNYNAIESDGSTYIKIISQFNNSNRKVKIFVLDKEHNSYSDMAVAYRGYLENEGVLKQKKSFDTIPLMIDVVMGANETGIFGQKLKYATTYKQAGEIVSSLSKKVSDMSVTLIGWGKGGYDTLPTDPKLESKFGGDSGWSSFVEACESSDVSFYLNMDFVNADKKTGSFNNRKDTVRLAMGGVLNYGNKYLLNPIKVFQNAYDKAVKKLKLEEGKSIRFDTVGNVLTYDYNKSGSSSRTMAEDAYKKTLKSAAKELKQISVSGGNQYVLPYASYLSGVPDKHSDYYFCDESVPFYQIVVHGSVDYTSSPGNNAYDLQRQKLKWIETGSLPYFIVTYENPVVLNKTSYNGLFSSQYSVWEDCMVEIYEEINESLKDVWNRKIIKHEIQGDLVVVTYEGNYRVYLNYSETAVRISDVEVPAMDYAVVKGE